MVAFACLWWPRVCSLGRWLASVCLGSVIAAGFVVACHGYAAWDAVPGSCWCWRPSSFLVVLCVAEVTGLLPLLWAVGVLPFVGKVSESGLSF